MPVRSLEFDIAAFEDLAWWVKQDRKKALRLIRLIQETQEKPFWRNWQARTAKA